MIMPGRRARSPKRGSRSSRDIDVAGSYRGPDEIRRVVIVGTGLIGSGWAAAFLAHGFELAVYDPAPQAAEKLSAHIARAWPALRELGLATASDPPPFQVNA